MRLWTVHPMYLDSIGLVALWREALLARAVLRGATVGYRHHPQLLRFRAQARPVGCVNRLRKLRARQPEGYTALAKITHPAAHPIFRIVPGPVRPWERRAATHHQTDGR